jgi:hypothetical protein
VPHPLVWKHIAKAPMFLNLKSINLRGKWYSQTFQKNHGESMLFISERRFFSFSFR